MDWKAESRMTTHLPGWSKMNFQKKSKPTASVAGRPSPKTLRKNKTTRSTKSEAQVPVEDCENNNSQESLEQDFKEKLDLESECRWSCAAADTNNIHWWLLTMREPFNTRSRGRGILIIMMMMIRWGCSHLGETVKENHFQPLLETSQDDWVLQNFPN